jgi:phosphoribosylformimino-5-aminoimidazole carboxamide ribotide isomerase
MRFRPCIDLHDGVVKQIVGATLSDSEAHGLQTNFQAEKPAGWFADRYRRDNLSGGHVIQLGKGNTAAARSALSRWPGGMQVGGGITADNAEQWLDAGASHVIVTSWVFHDGRIHMERLKQLTRKIGKTRLVLDLSCRKRGDTYLVATNRWQTFTIRGGHLPLVGPPLRLLRRISHPCRGCRRPLCRHRKRPGCPFGKMGGACRSPMPGVYPVSGILI